MNKLTLIFLTVICVLSFDTQLSAQQKIPAQKEALIREFLSLAGNKEDIEKMSVTMLHLQQAESEKLLAALIDEDKVLTAAEKEELKKAAAESSQRVAKRIEEFYAKELDLVKMLDEVALPLYADNFTEAELRELVAFYKTTEGQKTIKIAPQLMMDTMRVFSEKYAPKLIELIKKVVDEELEHLKRKLANGQPQKAVPGT